MEILSFQAGANFKDRIDARLREYIEQPKNQSQIPDQLKLAIEYGVNNGGKRIRPLLIYMISKALGADTSIADNTACAAELIHCYSLIHDDLPAMDDDELRRGMPTTHVKFGWATAILAGHALLPPAFERLPLCAAPAPSVATVSPPAPPPRRATP